MTKHPTRLSIKTASVFHRGFAIIFFALFVLIALAGNTVIALFGELGDQHYSVIIVILRWLFLTLCFAASTVLMVLAYRFLLSPRCERLDDRRFQMRVILIGVFAILALQLLCAYCFQIAQDKMLPTKDISQVERYVFQILSDNSYDCIAQGHNHYYIVKYPNNLPYLFLLTFLYRITYWLTGTYSQGLVMTLNTLVINLSILLTVLTARRIFGYRKAVFTLLLCAVFTPFYTFAAYYYTDTFVMPVLIGAVYAFSAALQQEKRVKKIVLLVLCGALIGVGFWFKATVAILLPAILLYLLLERGFKRMIKTLAPLLLAFVLVFASYTAVLKTVNIIPDEVSDRYQYPYTHWVMMGLKDQGAYNPEDSDLTASYPSKAEKTQANFEEIKNRIAEKGFFGMIYHLGFKATWTWMDGTYYVSCYLADYQHHTPLHSLVLYDGRWRFFYYGIACGFQLFLIFMMAYSAWDAARKRRMDLTLMLRIAVFGLYLFLLLWETNSRYPFHYAPLYLLLATDGVAAFVQRKKKKRQPKEGEAHETA